MTIRFLSPLIAGALVLAPAIARAADDPPSSEALMCPVRTPAAGAPLSSRDDDAPFLSDSDDDGMGDDAADDGMATDDAGETAPFLDPAPFSLLPSSSLGGSVPPRGEPSPFDDRTGDPLHGSLPPSSLTLASSSDKPYWRTNIFKRVLTDQAFLVVHWWPSEFKRVAFSAPLVTSIAFAARSSSDENQFDWQLEQSVANGSQGTYDETAGLFTKLGNGLPASMALGISYVLARHYHNDRLAEASSVSFEALLSTGLWVEVTKRLTARHRPTAGSNGKFFQYGQSDTSSFPSGHAAGAFTIATVFAHVYSDHKWVPWVAYGTAGLIGASRVALGRHFPSDVIAGAVIGNSIGRMALTRDGREGPLSPSNLQPIFDPKNKGFGVMYRYSW